MPDIIAPVAVGVAADKAANGLGKALDPTVPGELVSGAVGNVGRGLEFAGDFLAALGQRKTWVRVLMVGGGMTAVWVGVFMIGRKPIERIVSGAASVVPGGQAVTTAGKAIVKGGE